MPRNLLISFVFIFFFFNKTIKINVKYFFVNNFIVTQTSHSGKYFIQRMMKSHLLFMFLYDFNIFNEIIKSVCYLEHINEKYKKSNDS
jgi:hypothetical protein